MCCHTELNWVDYDAGEGGLKLAFLLDAYASNGATAITALCEEDGFVECYADLTVNLGGPARANAGFLDANNSRELCEFVVAKGWARRVGEGRSGFCAYPLVEFSREFIDEVCTRA